MHTRLNKERERVGERSLTWKALRSYVFSALDTLRCQRQQFEVNFLSLSSLHMHSAQATKCSVIKLNSYELCSLFLLYSIYVLYIYSIYRVLLEYIHVLLNSAVLIKVNEYFNRQKSFQLYSINCIPSKK